MASPFKGFQGKAFSTVKQSFRVLTGRITAGRAATIFPDDVYLVSYPKSGNTWLRFLIANLIHPQEEVNFLNIESVLPSIYILPDRELRKFSPAANPEESRGLYASV